MLPLKKLRLPGCCVSATLALCATLLSPLCAAAVATTADAPKVEPSGTFVWEGLKFFAGHFDSRWRRTDQIGKSPLPGYPKEANGTWQTAITLKPPQQDTPIRLEQQLINSDNSQLQLTYRAQAAQDAATQEFFLQIEIPLAIGADRQITIDGKGYTLPKDYKEQQIAAIGNAEHTLTLPAQKGTIVLKGRFGVLVQDQRTWKQDSYSLRLRFPLDGQALRDSTLEVTLTFQGVKTAPVSLRQSANFGFSDPVAKDRTGGWTDQGPENDMAVLPHGEWVANGGVPFQIIDETANDGRAAIVLGLKSQDFLPQQALIEPPANKDWRNLYLLHAGAWLPGTDKPIGHIVVTYEDGSQTRQPVRKGTEIGNWWSPIPLKEAVVGWKGRNRSSEVGLYVMRVPLSGKPVRSIALENEGTSMWMVAGITAAEGDIALLSDQQPWTVTANQDWVAHTHEIDIEAGSVFDFSHLLDAPAGKHGAVIITPEGRFAFADKPDERVRFWGVNLCFSANYLEKDEADALARRLARSGYNTIRIHHYDRQLGLKGGKSYELDPEQLDKLDYLFAAMKREGLYINLDLYTSRAFTNEELEQLGFDVESDPDGAAFQHWRFKAALPVLEGGFETWAAFAKNLLSHKNPYTGLTWAEDPALIGICPVNEDSPGNRIDNDPFVHSLFEKAFEPWWAKEENRHIAGGDRQIGFNYFVYKMHRDLDARIYDFLKNELGLRTPLTGSNYMSNQALTLARENYDFVDNHQYWDHPAFPQKRFQLPFRYHQRSATANAAPTPRDMMPSRILGKPFSVSEFNYVRPNRHRAEGGVLMPAYASLQDWDAIYNFEYSSGRFSATSPAVSGTFSLAADPIGMLADRTAAVLFLRGDIQPAANRIGFEVHPQSAHTSRYRNFPAEFSQLGLVTGIGSRVARADGEPTFTEGEVLAVVVNPEDASRNPAAVAADGTLIARLRQSGLPGQAQIDPQARRYRSETGQIELDAGNGTLRVITPSSEQFVLPAQARISGEFASVRNGEVFATVNVIAVDGEPLTGSKRLLVTHLTDALPSGMHFADGSSHTVEQWGQLPHLVRKGEAELVLRLDPSARWSAWAVSPSGKRLEAIELKATDGGYLLPLRTVSGKQTRLAYELARD